MIRTILFAILIVINVAAFAMYGLDKKRAIADEWRIPEATLLGVAAAFGSVGALFGMQTFHHKTRKPKFKYGVPLLLLVHLALFYLLFLWNGGLIPQ